MKTPRLTLAIMLLALLLAAAPRAAWAEGSCLDGFRAAFQKVSAPFKRLDDAVRAVLNRKGRAQSVEVQRILETKYEEAQKLSTGDDEQAWDEYVKKWQDDVTERMTDKNPKTYPDIDELLALMAAKSPTFKTGLLDLLNDHGAVRFKVLAHFMEKLQSALHDGERGGKVTTSGRHFWNLWQTRIRLPQRQTWTPEDFALFMTETSNAMFRALHPEPGFAGTWIKAFGQVRLDPESWKLWKRFADKFLLDYRARYKSFMEGVTLESYGKPRPDVIRDFYRWGMWDTVYRRLAAFKVALSKSGGKIIENTTGLKQEELDALNNNPLYSRMPRALKNALIYAKNPQLYQEVLFDAEVEQLSLEVMWFTRPVIEAAILYYTMIEPTYGAYEWNEKRKHFEKDVKEHPDKYMPDSKSSDDDRIKNFDQQIDALTMDRRQIEKELDAHPEFTDAEKALRRKSLARIDKRIGNLQSLKLDLQRSLTEVHP